MLHRFMINTSFLSSFFLYSASLDFSPELPQLQTINLRDIINPQHAQRSDTPEVAALSIKLAPRATPETPELSSNYR